MELESRRGSRDNSTLPQTGMYSITNLHNCHELSLNLRKFIEYFRKIDHGGNSTGNVDEAVDFVPNQQEVEVTGIIIKKVKDLQDIAIFRPNRNQNRDHSIDEQLSRVFDKLAHSISATITTIEDLINALTKSKTNFKRDVKLKIRNHENTSSIQIFDFLIHDGHRRVAVEINPLQHENLENGIVDDPKGQQTTWIRLNPLGFITDRGDSVTRTIDVIRDHPKAKNRIVHMYYEKNQNRDITVPTYPKEMWVWRFLYEVIFIHSRGKRVDLNNILMDVHRIRTLFKSNPEAWSRNLHIIDPVKFAHLEMDNVSLDALSQIHFDKVSSNKERKYDTSKYEEKLIKIANSTSSNSGKEGAKRPVSVMKCHQCLSDKVSWTTVQTRSSDEGMTAICVCENGHRWRLN